MVMVHFCVLFCVIAFGVVIDAASPQGVITDALDAFNSPKIVHKGLMRKHSAYGALYDEDDIHMREVFAAEDADLLEDRQVRNASIFAFCANASQTCTCPDGVVEMGSGELWNSMRVDVTIGNKINCTMPPFPYATGTDMHCRCYHLDSCKLLPYASSLTKDSAHRRRNTHGQLGRNDYQRRRWCGYGGIDCTWNPWVSWSVCSKTCWGTRTRTRSVNISASNGAHCACKGTACPATDTETGGCNTQACPGHSSAPLPTPPSAL